MLSKVSQSPWKDASAQQNLQLCFALLSYVEREYGSGTYQLTKPVQEAFPEFDGLQHAHLRFLQF